MSVLEINQSIMAELADNFLEFLSTSNQDVALHLLYWVDDVPFKVNTFQFFYESLAKFKRVSTGSSRYA